MGSKVSRSIRHPAPPDILDADSKALPKVPKVPKVPLVPQIPVLPLAAQTSVSPAPIVPLEWEMGSASLYACPEGKISPWMERLKQHVSDPTPRLMFKNITCMILPDDLLIWLKESYCESKTILDELYLIERLMSPFKFCIESWGDNSWKLAAYRSSCDKVPWSRQSAYIQPSFVDRTVVVSIHKKSDNVLMLMVESIQ
jgi:hypothetical protein